LPSGRNIRYDPQNRSSESRSLGDRPHSSAARRLYRRTSPSRSQTYTANGSCSNSRAGTSKAGSLSGKPRKTPAAFAFASTSMEVLARLRQKERGASEGTLLIVLQPEPSSHFGLSWASKSDILQLSRSASTIS